MTAKGPAVATLPTGRRVAVLVAIVVAGAAITALLVGNNREAAETKALDRAEERVHEAAADLQRSVDRSAEVVTSMANMISTFGPPDLDGNGVSEEQFALFVDPSLEDHPEFQALQYQQAVTADERDEFEDVLAERGFRGGIVEPVSDGGLRTAAERDRYVVITYNRPENPNRVVFGLDVAGRAEAAERIEEIAASGELAVADSIAIVQGGGETYAMPMYRPVYDPSMPIDTREQRREAFRGVAAAVLLYPQMVQQSLAPARGEEDFDVIDVSDGKETDMLAVRDGEVLGQGELASDTEIEALSDSGEPVVQDEVSLGGRTLVLIATPSAALVSSYEEPARWIILVSGILVTLLAAAAWWRWSQARRLQGIALALATANTQLEQGAARLRHLSQTDLLTGVPNRDHLRRCVEERVAANQPTTLVLVDLDRFKVINDSIGHRHGDELLRSVAGRLSSLAGEDDVVARMGSDEFAVMLTDPRDQSEERVERLLAGIARPFRVGDRVVHLTATAGVCRYPEDVWTGAEMMRNVDVALHEAKRTSRDHWVVYDHTMAQRVERRDWIERELYAALENADGTVNAHFQCRVDLLSGEIVGAEALARWEHPVAGTVPPSEFIPVAEESGLIVPLGALMLRQSCSLVRRLLDIGAPLRCVAVNVSGQQLSSESFAHLVRAELDRAEVPATMLALEVTETVLMVDSEPGRALVDHLQAVRDLGVEVSIDDFGTGYSSMSRLARLPVNELKVDQSFVAGLPDNNAHAGIVSAILSMAQHLDLIVVAEGVETADQLTWLRSHGCQEAQGWLFSRAVPADEFVEQVQPRRGPPEHWPPVGRRVSETREGPTRP